MTFTKFEGRENGVAYNAGHLGHKLRNRNVVDPASGCVLPQHGVAIRLAYAELSTSESSHR